MSSSDRQEDDDESIYDSPRESEGEEETKSKEQHQDHDQNEQGNGNHTDTNSDQIMLVIRQIGGQEDMQVTVNRNVTVSTLKQRIRQETGVEERKQKLIFAGRVLRDEQNLQDFSYLSNGSAIHLLVQDPQQNREQEQSSGTSSNTPQISGGQVRVQGDGQSMTMVLGGDATLPEMMEQIQAAVRQAFDNHGSGPNESTPARQNDSNSATSARQSVPSVNLRQNANQQPRNNSEPRVRFAFSPEESTTQRNADASQRESSSSSTDASQNNNTRNNGVNILRNVDTAAQSLRELMAHTIPRLEVHAGNTAGGAQTVSSVLRSLHRVLHAAELPLLGAADAMQNLPTRSDHALRRRLQGVIGSLTEQLQFLGYLMIQSGEVLRRVNVANNSPHAEHGPRTQNVYNELQQFVRGNVRHNPFQALLEQRQRASAQRNQSSNPPPVQSRSASITVGPFQFPFGDIASRIAGAANQNPSSNNQAAAHNSTNVSQNSTSNPSNEPPPPGGDDLD